MRQHASRGLTAATNSVRVAKAASVVRIPIAETAATQAARVGLDLSRVPARSPLEIARDGVLGPGSSLPYRELVQKSFGRHDISSIQAHGDSHANAASRALRASAFTLGNHVGFAGSPSLHTAAHEAAHVIQQNLGLSLAGGVGGVRDEHERHADAVADRVVRGQSSEALLDAYAPRGTQRCRNQLQLKSVKSAYGEFDTISYHSLTDNAGAGIGCEMYLRFKPGDSVDSTKIGLVQTVKSTEAGAHVALNAGKAAQDVTSGPGKHFHIDQHASVANPLYATEEAPAAKVGRMGAWPTLHHAAELSAPQKAASDATGVKGISYGGFGQHGFRKKVGPDWKIQAAQVRDNPTLPGSAGKANSGQQFETAALAVEGAQQGSYYGSVEWGWRRDGGSAFKLLDFKIVSMGSPSERFNASARKWNKSKTWTPAGGFGGSVIKLPVTNVFVTTVETEAMSGIDKLKLIVGTRVRVVSKGVAPADPWTVEIVDGDHTGRRVSLDHTILKRE